MHFVCLKKYIEHERKSFITFPSKIKGLEVFENVMNDFLSCLNTSC